MQVMCKIAHLRHEALCRRSNAFVINTAGIATARPKAVIISASPTGRRLDPNRLALIVDAQQSVVNPPNRPEQADKGRSTAPMEASTDKPAPKDAPTHCPMRGANSY